MAGFPIALRSERLPRPECLPRGYQDREHFSHVLELAVPDRLLFLLQKDSTP